MDPSRSVLRKSAAYALATASFGVTAADAAPIYFDAPDTVHRIDSVPGSLAVPFDIDGNGTDDFALNLGLYDDSSNPGLLTMAEVSWSGLDSNALVSFFGIATPLSPGDVVDSTMKFKSTGQLAKADASGVHGFWTNNLLEPNLIGLQFAIDGSTHYGWARVGTHVGYDSPVAEAIVYDWAYDDAPGTGIAAPGTPVPEPSSMALFALGSAGLAALRRRRRQNS